MSRQRPGARAALAHGHTRGTRLVARRSSVIYESLREQVDQFLAAYRALNPPS